MRLIALSLLVAATFLGLAATDLVLPAIPLLPASLGGTAPLAQGVMAAYAAGSGAGLLLFAELGARFDQRRLLRIALIGFAILSAGCLLADSLESLVGLRLLQGMAGSAALVFAPGMIRAMFDSAAAIRVLGVLGSVESVSPALAPLLGLWLVNIAGWQAAFAAVLVLAGAIAVALLVGSSRLPEMPRGETGDAWAALLRRPVFVRYALSQAFCLGGLLVFVFGAPAVMTGALGGSIGDFVIMQVCGITSFIIAANLSGRLQHHLPLDRIILAGTGISAAGGLGLLLYGLGGGADPDWIAALFVPMNLGLGLRGPPGFFKAIEASGSSPSRGVALVLLFTQLSTAAGTALAAPWITLGLVPLAAVALVFSALALPVFLFVGAPPSTSAWHARK